MIGSKAIQITFVVAFLMVCYEARYLLVNFERENARESHDGIIKPLEKISGNIDSKIWYIV